MDSFYGTLAAVFTGALTAYSGAWINHYFDIRKTRIASFVKDNEKFRTACAEFIADLKTSKDLHFCDKSKKNFLAAATNLAVAMKASGQKDKAKMILTCLDAFCDSRSFRFPDSVISQIEKLLNDLYPAKKNGVCRLVDFLREKANRKSPRPS